MTSSSNTSGRLKEAGWHCTTCGVSGLIRNDLIYTPGTVRSTGSCGFTRGCRGTIRPVTPGTSLSSSRDGYLLYGRGIDLVWKIEVPYGRVGRSISYDAVTVFNRRTGEDLSAVSLDDLSISLFLRGSTGEERRVLEGVDGVLRDGRVTFSLRAGTRGNFSNGGVFVISSRGDREGIPRATSTAVVDGRGTDERPLSVTGGRIAVGIDSGIVGDSPTAAASIEIGYSTRSDDTVRYFTLTLQNSSNPTVEGDPDYSIDSLSRITALSPAGGRVYNVYTGTLRGTPLLERGVVLQSVEKVVVDGILLPELYTDEAVAWVIIPRVDRTSSIIAGSDAVRIQVLDDIDPVYGVPLSRIRGNVVSDGEILRGVVVRPRVAAGDSLTLSLLAAEDAGEIVGRKLVTRIGTADWPTEFIYG